MFRRGGDNIHSDWESYILCKKSKIHLYGPEDGTKVIKNYDDGVTFCKEKGMALGNLKDVCPDGKENQTPFGGQHPSNQYVPVSDSHNEWVQIGNFKTLCKMHSVEFNAKPNWGTDQNKVSSKRKAEH